MIRRQSSFKFLPLPMPISNSNSIHSPIVHSHSSNGLCVTCKRGTGQDMTLTHCTTNPLLQMKIKPHTELFLAALPEVSMRPLCPSVLEVAIAKAELSDGEVSEVHQSPLNLGLGSCDFLSCPKPISNVSNGIVMIVIVLAGTGSFKKRFLLI